MELELVLDAQRGRIKFDDKTNTRNLTVIGNKEEQCQNFILEISFFAEDIFIPIYLELNYDLLNGVPDSEGS